MKVYKIIQKTHGKWTESPMYGELLSKEDIIWNSGVEDRNRPFHVHVKFYLKAVAKHSKTKVKLMEQKWKEYKKHL